LPKDAKIAVATVQSFYTALGAYIAFGLADQKIVISMFGYRANMAWVSLEAYVREERILREYDGYSMFFEDLICRIREYWPLSKAYKIDLEQIHDPKNGRRADPVLRDKPSDLTTPA
jgi:hypothetical protein